MITITAILQIVYNVIQRIMLWHKIFVIDNTNLAVAFFLIGFILFRLFYYNAAIR